MTGQHWLVRPSTIRWLWVGFATVLTIVAAASLVVQGHGYFGVDGSFAFNAWFGFLTCVAMVVAAKVLGVFLKRRDTYYDD